MGIQRIAPSQLHRDAERKIRELTQIQIRNTALRFRFTTLSQKFGSYNSYWRRTMRAIEQGRYIRDIARVTRKAQREGGDIPEELLAAMPKRMREKILRDRKALVTKNKRQTSQNDKVRDPRPSNVHSLDSDGPLLGDLNMDELFANITGGGETAQSSARTGGGKPPVPRGASTGANTTVPKQVSSAKPPPIPTKRPTSSVPTLKPPPGMSQEQSRKLYLRYMDARKQVGQRTDNVSYQKLLATLNKQAPRIMKQHGTQSVDFAVVVKDNKVVLKAKPKK